MSCLTTNHVLLCKEEKQKYRHIKNAFEIVVNNLNVLVQTVTVFKLFLIRGFSAQKNLIPVTLIHSNLVNQKLTSILLSSFIFPVLNCNFLSTKTEEQTLPCFQALIEIPENHLQIWN